ncbi:hypothetical protein ACTJKC_12390 [Pedobacter sp. 22226]|uniref:hypothetical protein n=1 Tax=Pedobacter sp. 22226 TaxID=3453894 RepID=UPI003F853A94
MILKTIFSFHPKFTIPFLFVFALIAFWSCKKNNFLQQDHEVITKKVLSKESPDFSSRLAAIKEKFYANKLDQKLIPNVKQSIVWKPDWEHPSTQVVNDSVSYIFYRLKAYLKQDGKLLEAKEVGMATYLMVKNEKEFFKAFYYHPVNVADKAQNSKTFSVENFTGSLLLKNLANGKSFLLDYVNGTVSQSYSKRRLLAVNRQTIKRPDATSYIETQCHTELRSCLFASDSPGYCSGIQIVSSETCQWPPSMCGVTYSLIDSSEETICEDVWFPDPPADPGESGGSGGGENASESNTIPEDPYMPGQDHEAINPKDYAKCFENIPDAGASYKISVQVQEPLENSDWNYGKNGVGHTAITLTKIGSNGESITQTIGFYPAGNKFEGPSKIVDNASNDPISFTIQMNFELGSNGDKFDSILDYISNPPKEYKLLGMNCTAFVFDACNSGGIILPSPWSNIAGFMDPLNVARAMTPAGLGQSMRSLKNNGDNRIKTNPGKAPLGKGSCK